MSVCRCIIMISVAIMLLACKSSAEASDVPRFDAYAAREFLAPPKTVAFSSSSFFRRYKTRLKAEAPLEPNFAGTYRLVKWGCGTSCVTGAVIDKKTGKVIPLPFTICCKQDESESANAIDFRANSRLIIFNGLRNEEGANGAHYYYLKGGRFVFVKTIPAASKQYPGGGGSPQ